MAFDPRALSALDFPRITQALAERTHTTLGHERARGLTPHNDPTQIERELDEVEDALFGVSLSLGGIYDIRDLYARCREGRVLSGTELGKVATSLDGAMTLARAVETHSRGALKRVAEGFGEHSELIRQIGAAIDRDGAVRDDASPRLRDLRKRIEPLRNRIREKLASTLDSWSDVLQENIVTIRRDRYVLPVLANRVGTVQGIIVDASATGQTYFVEPAAITGLNNELTRLILDEEAEVRKILGKLSLAVAADPSIPRTLQTVGELDLIAAKAALARDWQLTRPQTARAGEYILEGARHPLIEKPVANDISLTDTRLLLITGPNMGGKTATLKTLGLAVLMYQCGLYVAASHARLSVVRDILVDIGDEQSIEASLSTFASHLKHLRYVLKHAAPDTLVLVDELGSGTDPNEGAALAQALIEQLLRQGARGIITSHLTPLKLFALETPHLQNASMGFELGSLMPTFKLQVGQPGRSFALAIARRMGIEENVLTRAAALLGEEAGLAERLLEELEKERKVAAAEKERAQTARLQAEAELARVQAERETLEERSHELLAEAAQKAELLYADAIERVRTMRARAEDETSRPKIVQELRELRVQASRARPQKTEPKGDPIRVGSRVHVPAYKADGQVLEIRGDSVVVQLGLMKVSLARRDVRLVAAEKPKNPQPSFAPRHVSRFQNELQVRGMGVEAAVEEVRAAIAEARALREPSLRVVHGKGMGVLRRVLREYLKTDKNVESFSDAPANQGGHGVTLVTIKK